MAVVGHHTGVMLYQLSYQAPWEQGGGKEGIQVLSLVLGAHYICSDSIVTAGVFHKRIKLLLISYLFAYI